ncbi:hypothetical protein D3C84_1124490 [compost metagenome]
MHQTLPPFRILQSRIRTPLRHLFACDLHVALNRVGMAKQTIDPAVVLLCPLPILLKKHFPVFIEQLLVHPPAKSHILKIGRFRRRYAQLFLVSKKVRLQNSIL